MVDKYLNRNSTTGRVTEVTATVIGGTGSEAGKIVGLDGSGRLDTTIMPVGVTADTYSGTASEALTAGDFVYVATTTGQVAKASAASGGNDADGFVLSSSASAASALVYFEGRNTALSGLTVGARYYLSDSVPGGVTTTPVTGAGKRHQFIGKAITATSIAYEADDGITLA